MINVTVLDSGVRLVTEKIESVRSVAIGIWCDTGSVHEKKEEYGISHYIEHMLFKGTKNRDTFKIAEDIDGIGGQMNAFTGKESTCFYVKCLDEHFKEAADVLVDMISEPLFDSDEMEREKSVVIEEINMNLDDPDDVALENMESVLYRGTDMEHPIIGSKETVSAFTRDMVCDYYFDRYSRDALVVSVAGSFDEDEVRRYFSDAFKGLRGTCEGVEVKESDSKGEMITIGKDIEQAHLAMGVRTFPITDDRKYPLQVLNMLFGGTMSSRLFKNVREKKGLAYSVCSMTGVYSSTGVFAICAGIAKDRFDEALDGIYEELSILERERIGEKEFATAKEQLKSSLIFSRENIQATMIANGKSLLRLGRAVTQDELIGEIDRVSIDDVEAIKGIVSDKNRYAVVNVTSNEAAAAAR